MIGVMKTCQRNKVRYRVLGTRMSTLKEGNGKMKIVGW